MRVRELSQKEQAVLSLASEGLSDQEIRVRMGVSIHTVRGYWLRIRAKLGQGSRAELTAAAERTLGVEKVRVAEERAEEALAAANKESMKAVDLARTYVGKHIANERARTDELLKEVLTPEQKEALSEIRVDMDELLREEYEQVDDK